MFSPLLLLFCSLHAISAFPIKIPSWLGGQTTTTSPPPPPPPPFCGPKHLSEEFTTGIGNLSHEVNKEMGQIIARELAEFVNVSYSDSGMDKKTLLYIVEVGSFLELPYIMRVDAISSSFVASVNTTDDENVILFKARRVANRIENWAEDLKMLELEPRAILHQAMAIPFGNETAWKNSTFEEMERQAWASIETVLCK